MSAGTIKLTNGSTAVVGTSTTFTSDLKSGDVISTTISGVPYTLFVDTVTSNTALTLSDAFTGPTTTGAAYVAVPQMTLNRITAALAAQTAEAVRRVLQENANWQAFYSGSGDITVTLPNGTPTGLQISGPSWAKLSGIANSTWIDRGAIGTSDNINTYNPATTEGEWYKSVTTGLTTANGFPAGALAGVLKVVNGGSNQATQIYTDYLSNQWVRGLSAAWNGTNGPWTAWRNTGKVSLVTTTLGASDNLNTYNGRDLDGMYRFSIATTTVAANGVPFDGFRGWIVCQQGVAESNTTSQIAYTTDGDLFTRYIKGAWNGTDGPWSDWICAGGLSSGRTLPASAGLSDAAYFGQSFTYVISGTRADLPAGVNTNAVIMSVRRTSGTIAGLNQLLFTTTGVYYRAGAPNAATNWTSVTWYAGGDANGWRLMGADAMAAVGIGLSLSPLIANFDWQQADFITGSLQTFQFSASLNQPSGITYGSTTSVTVTTLQNRTSLIVVKVVPLTQSNGNRREYTVTISGAKGARTFTVNQNFNDDSSTTIGLSNGGTGANTVAGARSNLDVFSKGEIGQEFINGLDLSVSGAVITCSPGSAYVPGTGIMRSASAITATASSLTANTWLHVYLYNNGGTPALDLSTSVPAAYAYPAQNKTGAGGYRYLGSFRVGSAGTIIPQQCVNGRAMYLDDWAQHRVLSNGVATAATAINISTVVPTTAYSIEYSAQNASSPSVSVVMSTSSAATTGGPAIPGALAKMALSTPTIGYPNIYYQYASAPTGGLFIDVGGYSYDR